VRLAEGKAKVSGCTCAELLARRRDHKARVVEIPKADRCRRCGNPRAWPGPVGSTYADGTAECTACADAEVDRLLDAGRRAAASPDALADPAELMLRGGIQRRPPSRLPAATSARSCCAPRRPSAAPTSATLSPDSGEGGGGWDGGA
jgi:hypothetical protein